MFSGTLPFLTELLYYYNVHIFASLRSQIFTENDVHEFYVLVPKSKNHM